MSDFKVGDRVRIREDLKDDEEYNGTRVTNQMLDYRGKITTITNANDDYYLVGLDNQYWAWTKEMFERVEKKVISEFIPNDRLETKVKVKTNTEIKLENLEQRIEKLEKEVFKPVVEHDRPKEKSLLTEDERVILRNLDDKWEWIARDMEDNNLHIYTLEPTKVIDCWNVVGLDNYENFYIYNHLFQFIKWTDNEPYNIEELLKGECGNE